MWWDGRVVGGWAQRPDGQIVWELLDPVSAKAITAIRTEAARLATWIAEVRITPRFRTPLAHRLRTTPRVEVQLQPPISHR
ncbi:MAG TPA: crosslink repair DNA glycosylase YcaQ family protein [Pseudonocardiaceae bacterium]|nr:crosslink repair DNA glycosylase YcaQ family protein [Pseudonocardiaceae bacterium]